MRTNRSPSCEVSCRALSAGLGVADAASLPALGSSFQAGQVPAQRMRATAVFDRDALRSGALDCKFSSMLVLGTKARGAPLYAPLRPGYDGSDSPFRAPFRSADRGRSVRAP